MSSRNTRMKLSHKTSRSNSLLNALRRCILLQARTGSRASPLSHSIFCTRHCTHLRLSEAPDLVGLPSTQTGLGPENGPLSRSRKWTVPWAQNASHGFNGFAFGRWKNGPDVASIFWPLNSAFFAVTGQGPFSGRRNGSNFWHPNWVHFLDPETGPPLVKLNREA